MFSDTADSAGRAGNPVVGLVPSILDALLPASCIGCGNPMEKTAGLEDLPIMLCRECAELAVPIGGAVCATCGAPLQIPKACICGRFQQPSFDRARSVFAWAGPVRQIVLALKYSKRWEYAESMAALMAGVWRISKMNVPDVVVPVPLASGRFLFRGYNQSVLLGRAFALLTGARFDHRYLRRIGGTGSSRGMSREQRNARSRGSILPGPGRSPLGLRIIVVDDVLTTGSTCHECAAVLKAGGAASVDVITFARALPGT